MIGDAVPIRFSRRISRKARISPNRITRKKIRSSVKKRTSGADASLLEATNNAEIGRKNKLEENSKQTSKFLKQACHKLKPLIQKRSRKNMPQISKQKRKTRSSLDMSQSNLTTNKKCSQNLSTELQLESEKVTKKENRKTSADNKKQPYRRSLRLSKGSQNLPHNLFDENEKVIEKKNRKNSLINKENLNCRGTRVSKSRVSLSPKGNVRQKEIIDCYIKSSKGRKPSQNKSSVQVADINSISDLTPNSGKPTHTSKHSEIRTPARMLMKSPNQEISMHTPAFKSFFITPVHKGARTSKHSENRKSARVSKELNRSIIMNSEVSLCTPAFRSILESSHPEIQSEKRKSSRLLGSSPLRTLNKELPMSTPVSLLRKSPDSSLKKPVKPNKGTKLLPLQTDNRKQGRSKLSNKDNCTISNAIVIQKHKRHVNEKSSDKFKKPKSNETENFPFDVLTTLTPVSVLDSVCKRSISQKGLSKSEPSKSKSSKIKLDSLTSEKHVIEKLEGAKKGKKSAGDKVYVDNSTSCSKYRSLKKSACHLNADNSKKLKNREDCLTVALNNKCKIGGSKSDFCQKQPRRRVMSVPQNNEIICSSTISKRKKRNSTGNLGIKPVKRLKSPVVPTNVKDALLSNSSEKTFKTLLREKCSSERSKSELEKEFSNSDITICKTLPKGRKFEVFKEDCLTSGVFERKRGRAKSAPTKIQSWMKTLMPIKFTPCINLNSESNLPHSVTKDTSQLPIDALTIDQLVTCSKNDKRFMVPGNIPSLPLENALSNEISTKYDLPNIPRKGTLKRKRWMLQNLKEKNEGYEDDIFENQNFSQYKSAFHFGDESDGSSVNIATPKFDCILTPALPKKTPRFKDCMSPTEFLQARKTAEEYQYRRSKKRKSGDKPSSSGKKASMKEKNISSDIPEKKKLDFEEAVNKLIAVQKDLEKEAAVDDEEEDSYFSDVSDVSN